MKVSVVSGTRPIRGRTYDEIQSADLKIQKKTGAEKKRYSAEDLIYDMECGYIEFN